jgi:hypothetical protein
MLETEEQRVQRAEAAREDEIMLLINDPSSRVIKALLQNRNVTEEHVLIVANRKNLPPEIFDTIFKDRRWSESYPVRLALARNPKTPLFTAISIARFLRLFDVAELARNHLIPAISRKKMESIVIDKLPTLALGVKKTLAKVAAGDILLSLIADGYPDVVRICLDNPHLVEAHLYKVISRKTTTAGTIRTIAESRNWTCRYHIKFALIRNEHTPLSRSVLFLTEIKVFDLKELYRDPLLPVSVRPYIHRELIDRGEDPERMKADEEEVIHEISDGEFMDIDQEISAYWENNGEQEQRRTPDDQPGGSRE